MKTNLNISIELELEFDEQSKTFEIIKSNTSVKKPNQPTIIKMDRTLQVGEKRYGILTLGSKSTIGRVLPLDQDITIVYNSKKYISHSHKTVRGRLDRLTALIKKFHVGDTLSLEYDTKLNELSIITFFSHGEYSKFKIFSTEN